MVSGVRIHVSGVVQGVGFRPFIWTLAGDLGLAGWVRNCSSGVEIAVEGPSESVGTFLRRLRGEGPPRARIDEVKVVPVPGQGRRGFTILESRPEEGAYLPVSPDIAVCSDCLREMTDGRDRRYRYPFINCTNCGPRYTIVRDVPYDRPLTTMGSFALCSACEREYRDPADRRFHAQPVACPDCGPRLRLEERGGIREGESALGRARALLAGGKVVAIKGLGGYHLACNAADEKAVARLRVRKHREEKPLALLARDPETVASHARLTDEARALLGGPERPIVLLERLPASTLPVAVAPGRRELGFMLPYTPLHHLLVEPGGNAPGILVLTSGNRNDEPIAFRDEDARRRLGPIADAILLHDREIHVRCDDSVTALFRGSPYPVRRSRGYAPLPVSLPLAAPPLLAVGGELKNVFALVRDRSAFLSQHVGDLAHADALDAFETGIEHLQTLFRVRPRAVVHDLHPDYASTRYARRRAERDGIPALGVQHHHAHVAACMADRGLDAGARVIGAAFDGTGYGEDGAIWGGEFLVAGYAGYERLFHLAEVPLPGGDAAVRKPYRTALAHLAAAGIPWTVSLPPVAAAAPGERALLASQLERRVNCPPCTSLGRLFDAVAALAGFPGAVSYEAQAACELEGWADPAEPGRYAFSWDEDRVDPGPVLREVCDDVLRGTAPGTISMRFHRAVAAMTVSGCRRAREHTGIRTVALTGGVWQNLLLLDLTSRELERQGFEVLVHRQVPPNDGGIALGQAAVAAALLARGNAYHEPCGEPAAART